MLLSEIKLGIIYQGIDQKRKVMNIHKNGHGKIVVEYIVSYMRYSPRKYICLLSVFAAWAIHVDPEQTLPMKKIPAIQIKKYLQEQQRQAIIDANPLVVLAQMSRRNIS